MSERYHGLRFERKQPKWLPPVIFVGVILLIVGGVLFINHTYDEYIKLDYADKLVIDEYDALIKNKNHDVELNDLDFKDKAVLFISEDNFRVFLVNTKKTKNGLFSQEVKLADRYDINCYKISILHPGVIKILLSGDMPKVGKTYTLNGEEIYYYRYKRDLNVDEKYSSNHVGVELTFNMYNYYKQKDWKPLLEISNSMVTNEIFSAYYEVFSSLSSIQKELRALETGEVVDQQKLKEYAYQYVRAVDKMKEIDPDYTNKTLYRETYMGVPRYYSIKAAYNVNYKYGIMYYENEQDVSFGNIMNSINSGGVSKSFLYERGSYETGSLLCKLFDALGVDYRTKVFENNQDNKVTLYDILVEYLDVPEEL